MSMKEWVYRKQHHGLSFSELLFVWLALLGVGYLITRSLVTLFHL